MPSSPDSSQAPTPRPIVAAAIVDSLECPTRLLCASRAYPEELRGQFELPGGKVEFGEAPLDALAREIAEELGCTLVYGQEVPDEGGRWWPIHAGRTMGVWLAQCAPSSGAPTLSENHLELVWAALDSSAAREDLPPVDSLPWIVHDRPIVERLVEVATELRSGKKS
ncbi:NUDIX domain-containing protein [Schaalia sp. Marseille-Q2122]|uniref:NUDIX domain-containing protein n=1 Tax=Schaalia sp. Marseille-Q2122 TaxID=2736604 RepID=UPI0026DD6C82|nr:NUDIX domain-containing protein [Schaalia sp. Marseille-Q2122]